MTNLPFNMAVEHRVISIIFVIILCVENRIFAGVIENDTRLLYVGNDNEDRFIKFMDRVKYHGYTAEEYKIKSQDGYHLVLHRISGSPAKPPSPGKRVVYFQHGLLMSSDQFVINGPGQDFVHLLAEAGYDVWLGNTRGNSYSRHHDFISPKNDTFWDFSFHESAVYDVKAFIDHILNVTGQEKFVYIGFSLGSAIGYIFFSLYPEYNEKVDLIVSLGTIALWKHNNDVRCVMFRSIMKFVERYNEYIKLHEFLPSPTFVNRLTTNICESGNFFKIQICKLLFRIMFPEVDLERMPTGALKRLLKTFPSGTSAKTLFHLGQNLRSGDFQEYDYKNLNLKKYGTTLPPLYPLHKITAPVAIYYGMKDFFGNIDDLRSLRRVLPNVIVFQQVDDPNFSHFDIILDSNAKEVLFDTFIKLINTVRS